MMSLINPHKTLTKLVKLIFKAPQPETTNYPIPIITANQKQFVMRKKRRNTKGKTANTKRMTLISERAKKIRKRGEVWTNAIKRASVLLKREGKL